MIIAVGSKNPVKIASTMSAFTVIFPNEKWEVKGVEVTSDVTDQPMSDSESMQGATNRARKAIKEIDADYGVGLEGGVQEIDGKWFECGWIVVIDTNGHMGIGSSFRVQVPREMMKYIKQGIELGKVHDMLFNEKNSQQKNGFFGLMTHDTITRELGYRDGVIAALGAFVHKELFKKKLCQKISSREEEKEKE